MTVYGSAYGQHQSVSMNGMEISIFGNNGANGMPSAWKSYGKNVGTKADERISDYAIKSFRRVRIEWKDGKTTVIHFQDGILEATIPDGVLEVEPWIAVVEESGWRYQITAKSEWVYL